MRNICYVSTMKSLKRSLSIVKLLKAAHCGVLVYMGTYSGDFIIAGIHDKNGNMLVCFIFYGFCFILHNSKAKLSG